MANKSGDVKALSTEVIGADAVLAYLLRHPDFLAEHPELYATLTPPEERRGAGVLDLQRHMIDRLRERVRALEAAGRRMEAVDEANAAIQGRVQTASLALLAVRSFENLIETMNQKLPAMLDVETFSLCVETDGKLPAKASEAGVRVLKPGAIDRVLGKGTDILLLAEADGSRLLFGTAAERVKSMALARLSFGPSTPPGLLALGAAKPDGFQPGQRTDLLAFFAHVVEHSIRRWLSQAP
jgi:hypothetical protein